MGVVFLPVTSQINVVSKRLDKEKFFSFPQADKRDFMYLTQLEKDFLS